ncbi:error-prone DNA polymerase [Pseudolysobacter antarcticus]|uniref:Error-prone DNA polymerase n=1 Tax=Pseudolysobacter antarcticus TaxID=2511995 RepID=A0A411HJM0_9GAMM|nr:error-prone DNA polymerase [Pseudolysobacter antarcticus]QBB70681.1 error-prone DNA polymerase [Pseudolysobacter antarcticus]
MSPPAYAELHCLSNFTFLRGASSALELAERAKKVGYRALAITDECTLAGIVRAYEATKKLGLPLIVGSEIRFEDGMTVVLLVQNTTGYTALCRLITRGRRNAQKGQYQLSRQDLGDTTGLLALWIPSIDSSAEDGRWLSAIFPDRAWLAVELHRGPDDATRLRMLMTLASAAGLPAVAAGNVHMHVRRRRALQDTLTAIRHRTTVHAGCEHLFKNGERHLRRREALATIYPQELLDASVAIAARCTFLLDHLHYEYPRELVPATYKADAWLRELTETGARWRWPQGIAPHVRKQLEHELVLIAKLKYESYFLTVHDIVRYAREQGILCQGRGSAANSAVCFALGITEVNPAFSNMLFERFISAERNEPPDIDVDFEHERREEVIQYIYRKYGRDRAALAATVICYRSKSAVRDVAKALGMTTDQVDQLSRAFTAWDNLDGMEERLRECGFQAESPAMQRLMSLARDLIGFPRHLSQHVGGFVISEHPLHEIVPVENAAMPDRTIIQWDKDDLDTLGLLKVDVLALGMLTCIRKCFDLLRAHRGLDMTLATIPAEDTATYAMIQKADTVGVFQIESRAQMSMLPRLKPATYYDLVIEVAIVRPGPIQGKMVHPYLRRRQGLETYEPLTGALAGVLDRTLGVPLFQEQAMQLAILGAGFSPGEANDLRRGMAAWKRHGGLEQFHDRLLSGMQKNGYTVAFAEHVFEQMRGFGSYGFPESHSASFALLTYVSCWLKCHEPAAFACALLNSAPMGFYTASQIVQDARKHGIRIYPVDVRFSQWNCTLEPQVQGCASQPIIRLGLREVRGFREDVALRITCAREQSHFLNLTDLCDRAALDRRAQSLLADANALRGLTGNRHRARWAMAGVEPQLALFGELRVEEESVSLPMPTVGENLIADYASTGLTLGPHPMSLLRRQLTAQRCKGSVDLRRLQHGTAVRAAGLVTLRQRPATANGTTFLTLEDEAGMINVVIWQRLAQRQRRVLLESRLLAVDGVLESADGVQHLIAGRLIDLTKLLGQLDTRSRDFY